MVFIFLKPLPKLGSLGKYSYEWSDGSFLWCLGWGAGKDRREIEIKRGGRGLKETQLECNVQKGRARCTGIRPDTQDTSCICVTLSPLSGDNKVEDTYTVTVTLSGARASVVGKAPRKQRLLWAVSVWHPAGASVGEQRQDGPHHPRQQPRVLFGLFGTDTSWFPRLRLPSDTVREKPALSFPLSALARWAQEPFPSLSTLGLLLVWSWPLGWRCLFRADFSPAPALDSDSSKSSLQHHPPKRVRMVGLSLWVYAHCCLYVLISSPFFAFYQRAGCRTSTGAVIAIFWLSIGFLRFELVPLNKSLPHFFVSCCLSMTIRFQNF